MVDFRHYIDLITEAQHDALVDAIIRQFPDQKQEIQDHAAWASQTLKKADRINWYLGKLRAYLSDQLTPEVLGDYRFTTMQQLQHDLAHFYGYNSPAIDSYQYRRQSIGDLIRDLKQLEAEWVAKQNQEKGVDLQPGDYVLFEFAGGIKWWWINRAYCSEEGRSGKHCGNVTGQTKTDQRILSLRNARNQVILTFILEPDGTLGEMKAKGNQKPDERYHPHIMKLLLWDKIKGISGMGHLPDMNFSVFDLNVDYLNELDQHKPKLISDQTRVTPLEILNTPDNIKQKYSKYAIARFPVIQSLLADNSLQNWTNAISKDENMIVYLPIEYYNSIPNFKDKLLSYLVPENQDDYSDNHASNYLKLPKIIRNDPEFAQQLVQRNPIAIKFVNTNIKNYTDLVKYAIDTDWYALSSIPEEYRTEELCSIAFSQSSDALFSIPEKIKLKYPEINKIAVSDDGFTLQAVPDQLKTEEICKIAVSTYGRALNFVPEDIKLNHPEVIEIAINNDPAAIVFVPELVKLKYPKLSEVAVSKEAYLLGYVPEKLRTEKICTIALKNAVNMNEKKYLLKKYVPKKLQFKLMKLFQINKL